MILIKMIKKNNQILNSKLDLEKKDLIWKMIVMMKKNNNNKSNNKQNKN